MFQPKNRQRLSWIVPRRLALLPCALVSVLTQAAPWGPIDVTLQAEGLSVIPEASVLHHQAIVSLLNEGAEAIDCQLVFRNGPQTPVQRQVALEPQEVRLVTAPIRREITRLHIEIQCQGRGTDSAATP